MPNFSSLAGLEVAEKFVVVRWGGMGWVGGEHFVEKITGIII